MDKYFWCIGGGSLQVPVVNEAKKLGYKIIVTDRNPECDCAKLADIFSDVDIFDIKRNLGLLVGFRQNDDMDICGVLAAGIDANVTHSYLDTALGHYRTASIEAAITCHDKLKFRQFQRYMHYPHPKFREAESTNDIVSFIHDTGIEDLYLKETTNSAGRGMKKLGPYSHFQKNEFIEGRHVLEEALCGTEHTVETLMCDGGFYPCFITDRHFEHKSKNRHAPMIEVGLRNPTVLPEWKQRVMFATAYKLCKELGIRNGAMKLDVVDTLDGPIVLEATTRLSGGFDCQYLVPAATGQNVIKAAILNAVGRGVTNEAVSMALQKTKDKVALSESLWPEVGKKITKIDDSKALKLAGVELIYWRYRVGDVVEDYVDSSKRVCFIIVSGNTYEQARDVMDEAKYNIVLEVE